METPQHEVRVGRWVEVGGKMHWAGSKVAAYRIWQRCSQWGWEQRHEWRLTSGATRMDSWIRGLPRWNADAEKVES